MRVYITGTMTVPQETFLPTALYFANENADDALVPSKDSICLEGISTESKTEGNEFNCRWKGVTMTDEEEHNENFTKQEFIDRLKERKLTMDSMDAYMDADTKVKVTSVTILDGEWGTETHLSEGLLQKEIEFVS